MRLLTAYLVALRFLRAAIPRVSAVSFPASADGTPGLELVTRIPTGNIVAAVRSLTFLENPDAPLPCSWTPAGPMDRALQSIDAAPAQAMAKATRIADFGAESHGFSAGCLRFAVQGRPCPRKTRFRLWPALPVGIGYPKGFHERFPVSILYITFPLSQAS
jgi:hypothetical protein